MSGSPFILVSVFNSRLFCREIFPVLSFLYMMIANCCKSDVKFLCHDGHYEALFSQHITFHYVDKLLCGQSFPVFLPSFCVIYCLTPIIKIDRCLKWNWLPKISSYCQQRFEDLFHDFFSCLVSIVTVVWSKVCHWLSILFRWDFVLKMTFVVFSSFGKK